MRWTESFRSTWLDGSAHEAWARRDRGRRGSAGAPSLNPVRTLLLGPEGHGGEEVYVQTLLDNPPPQVEYVRIGGFHKGGPGAACRVVEEVLLNRVLHPWAIPDMGFRALALTPGHFDLVHVHAHPVRLTGLGKTPLVMSEGSSSAVYLRDYLSWDEPRLSRAFSRSRRMYRACGIHDRLLNLDRVNRAYVFSNWAREINIRWGADAEKMDVVYPGFPTPTLGPVSPRDHFTFLFIGTDFERKGGFEVIEAFETVASEHPDARLLLVCPDPALRNPDRAMHSWVSDARRARALQVVARLQAEGRLERRDLAPREVVYREIYPRADAFVMPTHAEGFGFTNAEALSFALPVISSRVGAVGEVVDDGVTGLLLEPGDVESLAAAMTSLLVDPTRARAMGTAARAAFLERFTLDRFRQALGRVYARAGA
jgi:glycosyltransferase involved in cell wall biosynthesis